MNKCFITTIKVTFDDVNIPIYGYKSSFETDSNKHVVMNLDHARVKVFGTEEPCIDYISKENLGTDFSVEESKCIQFPCGDKIKVYLDLRNSLKILGDEYSSKFFKNFHLEKVKNATEFIMGKENSRLLDIDNVFDDKLDLDELLNQDIVDTIQVLSNKTNGVKLKMNVNNFTSLKSLFLSSRVDASESYINIDTLPDSLKYIEYISDSINASGNIKSLASIDMQRIQVINSSNIQGKLEEVVEIMWSKGRREGVVPILIEGTNATFHDVVPTFNTTVKFEASGCTVYKSDSDSGDVIATYNGTTWNYN